MGQQPGLHRCPAQGRPGSGGRLKWPAGAGPAKGHCETPPARGSAGIATGTSVRAATGRCAGPRSAAELCSTGTDTPPARAHFRGRPGGERGPAKPARLLSDRAAGTETGLLGPNTRGARHPPVREGTIGRSARRGEPPLLPDHRGRNGRTASGPAATLFFSFWPTRACTVSMGRRPALFFSVSRNPLARVPAPPPAGAQARAGLRTRSAQDGSPRTSDPACATAAGAPEGPGLAGTPARRTPGRHREDLVPRPDTPAHRGRGTRGQLRLARPAADVHAVVVGGPGGWSPTGAHWRSGGRAVRWRARSGNLGDPPVRARARWITGSVKLDHETTTSWASWVPAARSR